MTIALMAPHTASASAAATARRQRGITLLEMLVAMTIMAISITIIYRAVGGSVRGVEQVGESQHAMQIMQSLLDAYPVIDPQRLYDSGQDGNLTWAVSASPYGAAPGNAGQAGDAVVLYQLNIDIRSPAGRQWQTQTLRPLLRVQGG